MTFRVTGRGRIGADGLVCPFLLLEPVWLHKPLVPNCFLLRFFQAIWYTENQGLDGPVFGSADLWNGVGVFFDSFDNDGKVYFLLKLLAIFHFTVFLAELGCEKVIRLTP